jgi:CheY-like chemotaxis protein
MSQVLHILIVDDQPETLMGLAGQLSDRGHRVEVLADSLEALARIQQSARDPFHLALLDVNLPGLDGPGLVREIRRRGERMPVAFVTGYQSVAGRLRGELSQLRALAVVIKPPPPAEIDRLLEQATRAAYATTQDRRSTEFGSGGHAALGRTPTGLPVLPGADDIPYYGATRSIRRPTSDDAPSAGALSRIQKPTGGPDIIPDTVVTGRIANPAAPLSTPLPGASGIRRGIRSPLPTAYPESAGSGLDGSSAGHTATPGPSRQVDFLQPGDIPSTAGPLVGYRDPVTGVYKQQKSGMFPPEPPRKRGLSDPALVDPLTPTPSSQPGTTSRFRRSVTDAAPGNPAPTPGTGRIRRSITGSFARPPATPPIAAPAESEAPSCTVACAHCNGQFMVLIKPQSYTVVCIHCGKLNRIDPLS